MTGWTVYHERIPEIVVPGKPLGRHVRFDSRSLAYAWRHSGVQPVSKTWTRHIPILDQDNVGACTGNAEEGALGTDPLFAALTTAVQQALGEPGALSLYSAAETIDGDGPYPPNDNGSSGTSVCQAAKNAGLISGYQPCLSLADMIDALQSGPVIVGVNWYDSFDTPGPTGLVTITPGAQVRGGHEFLVRGVDMTASTFGADNSWGTSWGIAGSFYFSFATMTRLLAEQGDCMAPVPLSQPVPVPVPPVPVPGPQPVPVPPAPTPPVPVPVPVPPYDSDDLRLAKAVSGWSKLHHFGSAGKVSLALLQWLKAKGLG